MQTQTTDSWAWWGGKEGEGGVNGESIMEACTLRCIKQSLGICCMMRGTETGAL